MEKKLVIAIDGPAGAGKTTIAEALSKRLNILYLNTGALYRALAIKCIKLGANAESEEDAEKIAKTSNVEVKYQNGHQHTILNGEDVTNGLNQNEVSTVASVISKHKSIRASILSLQQSIAKKQSVIMDGRDIGSVVLPMANFKFYLDADVKVRAERRHKELVAKGSNISYEEVLADMIDRDYNDTHRSVSPLKKCEDSIVIDCTNLNIQQVVDEFLKHINKSR
jgi:cytidylate kinase